MPKNHILLTKVFLLAFVYLLTSISNKTECQTNVLAPVPASKKGVTLIYGHNYFFEPDTSTISGTLKVEMYYGPPNYGESPATDAKEDSYIFYPNDTINVIQKGVDSSGFDNTTKNVIKFQLAPMGGLSLHPFINKKIRITGQFFGAETGHHHTDVLMSVIKAEKL